MTTEYFRRLQTRQLAVSAVALKKKKICAGHGSKWRQTRLELATARSVRHVATRMPN